VVIAGDPYVLRTADDDGRWGRSDLDDRSRLGRRLHHHDLVFRWSDRRLLHHHRGRRWRRGLHHHGARRRRRGLHDDGSRGRRRGLHGDDARGWRGLRLYIASRSEEDRDEEARAIAIHGVLLNANKSTVG
jgi:hypothetical protein